MPEFPWLCPSCGSDDVHYEYEMRYGWLVWKCTAGRFYHMFVTIQY